MPTSQFDILTQKAAPRREWSEEPRQFPVLIGVGSTILFHILLWFVAPLLPLGDSAHWKPKNDSTKGKTFDFVLERLPEAPPEPDRFRYVETNPEAPANEPDKTVNISNRNQQSAQEVAATEIDPENHPTVKGREDIDPTNAIVAGNRAPQEEVVAEPPPPQTSEQPAQQARAEQIPLPGLEKFQGDALGGIGTDISPKDSPTNHAERFQDGTPDSKDPNGSQATVAHNGQPQPKPRPRLKPARPNVLSSNLAGTRNIGVLGIDARWSEFGEYLDEMFGIIEAQWNVILNGSSVRPSNGRAVIKFRINSEGQIQVTKVEDFVGQYGTYAAVNAIEARAPYRKWTQQMIAIMGTDQEITISFWYQ